MCTAILLSLSCFAALIFYLNEIKLNETRLVGHTSSFLDLLDYWFLELCEFIPYTFRTGEKRANAFSNTTYFPDI